MNSERLKKLIYDLEITSTDMDKSIKYLKLYAKDEELKQEFANSLKYKFLSLFIIYEDFISMLLKEHNLYEIAMSIDLAIKKLSDGKIIEKEISQYLNMARLLRNKIGHRYKQPSIEVIVSFLEENELQKQNMYTFIKGHLK